MGAMKRKMKGVTWKPNKQRWVVEFKSENKLRYFGSFKTYCEAVRRASDVWPTLPIAKRKIKTCTECGKQGVVPHQFEFRSTTCKECKSIRREDKWIKWSMNQIVAIRRNSFRRAKYTGWVQWAAHKTSSLLNRGKQNNAETKTQKRRVCSTWDEWLVIERTKFNRRGRYCETSEWNRKTKQWTGSLIRRERQRLKMNCDR